jgi:polyferredoxin
MSALAFAELLILSVLQVPPLSTKTETEVAYTSFLRRLSNGWANLQLSLSDMIQFSRSFELSICEGRKDRKDDALLRSFHVESLAAQN